MRNLLVTMICVLGLLGPQDAVKQDSKPKDGTPTINLGNFSVSLTVKDLNASRAFYEKLGFRMKAGEPKQNWIVLQNETATIGLFQGMFERNMLTFNPGWDRNKATLKEFEDVRTLQKTFKDKGLKIMNEADPASTGPAAFMLVDPDGNPILIDQHVPKPEVPKPGK
jgi:catechol 2,3-dioxygenase-like lactoylglutathione lyase family enzyme